jgi:hypothetical protein
MVTQSCVAPRRPRPLRVRSDHFFRQPTSSGASAPIVDARAPGTVPETRLVGSWHEPAVLRSEQARLPTPARLPAIDPPTFRRAMEAMARET